MTKPTHDPTEMLRLGSFPTRGCAPIHTLTQPCSHTHVCHPQAFNHVMFPTLGPAYLLGRCCLVALGESPGILAYVSLKPSKALGSRGQRAVALDNWVQTWTTEDRLSSCGLCLYSALGLGA